jgi:hypothetical protein
LFRRLAFLVAVVAASVAHVPCARAANDPKLVWKTLETEHFRINFYSTENEVAARVATLAESIHARLVPAVGWAPGEKTEINLTDQSESANGAATALPYDAIWLNVTAPDDMSPLGDVDDWYLELVTHEYTHVLHLDHIEGIPALVNKILGKTLAPNNVQPHWLKEGLAVFEESARTSGGRLRSSMWNMWMRADVLEDSVATLDVFSHTPRRWPQGNIAYLYGSFFLQWIAETYGEQAIRAMIDDYAHQIIPYAINRSIRRATGRTFEQLYGAWVDSMQRSFGQQAEAIRERGLREGRRITHGGNTAEHPRWIPANAWAAHAGDILYYADDGQTRPGQWAVPLVRDRYGRVIGARERDRELMIRDNGPAASSFMPDGGVAFSGADVHENLFVFNDLFELPAHETSRSGLEGRRERWSDGWRALDPSVSPDGRRVVFTTNHRGTTYLMIADLVASPVRPGYHALANVRRLVDGQRFDQAFTPRWSPDNRHVAYGAWQHGGYRDVRIVNTQDLSVVDVTHDRAIDGDPAYSADGRWLYFHSDRSGVSNIYAYEIETGVLKQVTNVINGAYQPEPSPDGKSFAYVGYTHEGYDIFVMALDESQWLDPLPYEDERPSPPAEPPPRSAVVKPYDPLVTLMPRKYSVRITPGYFGEESIIAASGSDIAGIHTISLQETTDWNHPVVEGSISYSYGRLPVDVSVSAFRQIAPATYVLGNDSVPWIQETVGATTALGYAMPRAFDSQSFSLSYSFARVGGRVPVPVAALNPYDSPSFPTGGTLGTLHMGWSYSNAESYLWSVGNENGFTVGATLDLSDPALASDSRGYAATMGFDTYFKMPWLQHHVLALRAAGGSGGDNRAGQRPFYLGGYQDLPLIDIAHNTFLQGTVQLRGYPPIAEQGNYYGVFNAEYRFPILNVDRGLSTMPIFLNRITGAGFVDYGSAFDNPNTAKFKTGVGGELWFDLTLGYVVGFNFRAGFARGLASGGIDKAYFVAAVPLL